MVLRSAKRRPKRLDSQELADVARLHSELHLSLSEIAGLIGISRMGVQKALKRMGYDTSKATACHIDTTCAHCGKSFSVHRCKYKYGDRQFCCQSCYYAWVDSHNAGPRVVSRQGMRLARQVVSTWYTLQPGNVVHHIDRDNRNNDISNLMGFACNGDHVRHHRGKLAVPLFDGRTCAVGRAAA